MLSRMNNILADSGGSVAMKRKGKNEGEFFDVSEGEVRHTDSMMKMKAVGDVMKDLSFEEKLLISVGLKEEGNLLYRESKHREAIEKYLQVGEPAFILSHLNWKALKH